MMRIINRICVILLLVSCCSCSLFTNEDSLKKQAKAYVDRVLPGIVTSWDSKQLLWNSHPEFVKKTSAEQLDQFFFAFMKLGSLKKYDESQGRVSISKLILNGRTSLFCDYVTQLDFENGSAKISVRVVKEKGEWSIFSFFVESDLLKNAPQKAAAQDETHAKEEPLSGEQLEELVQKLPADNIIQLRRSVDKVFAQAEIYERESKDEEAIGLYERALEADPANLPYQFKLARLLIGHNRMEDGISKLRCIYEFAEDDGLLMQTRDLLNSTKSEIVQPATRQVAEKNIEIVLVPMGNPSGLILSELRAALQERLGIAVSISDHAVDLREADRKNADLLISKVFIGVQQNLNQLQRDLIMREFRIADGDLNSPEYQAHFIRAVFSQSGEQGRQQFEAELKRLGDSGQYNITRLAGEIRRAFPVDSREIVKAYLGVTPVDLYMDCCNTLFGGSDGIYGVISYYQFTAAHNGGKQCRPLVVARILKQALSTSNLIFDIPRCNNPYCARSFPFTLAEHDAKSDKLCPDCLKRLQAYIKSPRSYAMASELGNRAAFYSNVENNLDKAIELYQKALENKPDFGLAYENMGLVYEKKGLRDLSITNFRKALQLSPGLENANLYLGYHCLRSNEPQQAIEHFSRSLEKGPENASTHEGLGKAYYQLKQWEKAIEHLEFARKLNPRSAQVHLLLGGSYNQLKNYEEAANSFSDLIEVDPDMRTAHYDLGLMFLMTGKKDRAMEQFKKELEINPSDFGSHYELGRIFGKDGLLDDSISMYKAAIAIKPEDAKSWSDLGYTYYLKKNYREAIEQYEKALKIEPANALAHYNKAMAHYAQAQFREAIEEYDKAAGLGYPGSPRFRDALQPFRK
jgi:tetratricopeptide (TPR) repeat protein